MTTQSEEDSERSAERNEHHGKPRTSAWRVMISSISSSRSVMLPEMGRCCARPSEIEPATDIISEALLLFTGDTSNAERFRCDNFRADVDGTGRGERVAAMALNALFFRLRPFSEPPCAHLYVVSELMALPAKHCHGHR